MAGETQDPTALELGTVNMHKLAPGVWVAPMAPGVWLHSTTKRLDDGTWYPVNGLMVERPGGAIMIDTANNAAQAKILAAWWRGRGQTIRLAVATHFHSDRTGGIGGLREMGVRTVALPLTVELARAHGMEVPEAAMFAGDVLALDAGVEVFAPGAGHTRDNVVVWVRGPRVLFGGCLIKSVTAPDLGWVADAVMGDWAGSVRRVRGRYPEAAVVVPGHGTIRGDGIGATLGLLGKA